MAINHRPIIFTKSAVNFACGKECDRECPDDCVCDCDCDCACGTENTTIEATSLNVDSFINQTCLDSAEYLINPDLFTEKIDDDFFFIFPFMSNTGVVVINKITKSILDVFKTPRRISEVKTEVNYLPDFDFSVCVRRLIDLSLIIKKGQNKQIAFLPSTTLTTWFQITDDCNLRCTYCYIPKSRSVISRSVGENVIISIIKSAKENGFNRLKIKFSGGEATKQFHLVQNLYDYAQDECRKSNLELQGVILSNGVSISDSMITSLVERNLRLMISLDGIGTFHNSTRKFINGQGSFASVEKTINRLLDRCFLPEISITVTNKNSKGLADIVLYLLQRNLMFSFNFFRNNPFVTDTTLSLERDPILEGLREAFMVIESRIPERSFLGSIADRANFLYPHSKTCGVGENYLVIDTNGNISKCQMTMSKSIGNITETADPLSIIRTDSKGIQNISVDDKQECNHCKWRYWCAGGCPLYTFTTYGRYGEASPNCEVYKEIFPNVLRLEALRIKKYSQKNPL